MGRKMRDNPVSRDEQVFFLGFYKEKKTFIFYIAGQLVREQECPLWDREDLAQEITLRLMKNIPTLRTLNGGSQVKYIAQTAERAYIDLQRKNARVQTLPLQQPAVHPLEATLTGDGPDGQTCQLQEELSPRDWMALEGKYILGYSYQEIGELLNMSPDSAKTTVSRAKKRARKLLEKEGE